MNTNGPENPAMNTVSTFASAIAVAQKRAAQRGERQKVQRIKGTCSYRVKDA